MPSRILRTRRSAGHDIAGHGKPAGNGRRGSSLATPAARDARCPVREEKPLMIRCAMCGKRDRAAVQYCPPCAGAHRRGQCTSTRFNDALLWCWCGYGSLPGRRAID